MKRFRIAALLALSGALLAMPAGAAEKTPPVWNSRQIKALRCRCCGRRGLDPCFEHLLLRLQARVGSELRFTSGRRCPRHNAHVGGVRNSRHLRGQAADVAVPAVRQRAFCAAARALGFRRVLPDARRNYVHLSL